MKRIFPFSTSIGLLALSLTSCIINLDPSLPMGTSSDEIERTYSATTLGDFNRLDMGSAFLITVVQGNTPSLTVKGDRRDVEDLELNNRASTLNARYRTSRSRRYTMNIRVTMPTLRGVTFTGATKSDISGFRNLGDLSVDLSGASKAYFDVQASRTTLDLSGASKVEFVGSGQSFRATVSGASHLQSFNYPVAETIIDVSGASHAYINTSNMLTATASGASKIRYRGNPTVQQVVTGASKVEQD